jgi:hypothetical protein
MNIDFAFRCARAWWFLSLDLVAEYREPLRLSWFGPEHLAYVRSALDPKGDLPVSHHNPRVRTYERLQGFRELFGQETLETLLWWQRSVYQHGGDDRAGESLWRHFVHAFKTSDHQIASVFESVRHEVRTREDALASPTQLSGWDQQVLAAEESSVEELETTIELILTYNIFAEAWRRTATPLGMAFLTKVFQMVCADEHVLGGVHPEMLPFPSSWEIELKL